MKETDHTWENVRGSEQTRESAVLHMTIVTGIGQRMWKRDWEQGRVQDKWGETKHENSLPEIETLKDPSVAY